MAHAHITSAHSTAQWPGRTLARQRCDVRLLQLRRRIDVRPKLLVVGHGIVVHAVAVLGQVGLVEVEDAGAQARGDLAGGAGGAPPGDVLVQGLALARRTCTAQLRRRLLRR